MAQQTYDRRGADYDEDDPANVGPDGPAAGDSRDPRDTGYDPQTTPMMNDADPRGDDGSEEKSRFGQARDLAKPGGVGKALWNRRHKSDGDEDEEDERTKQDLRDAEDGTEPQNSEDNEDGEEKEEDERGEASPSDLNEEEEDEGGLYNDDKDKKSRGGWRGFLKRNKKKIGIGGGAAFLIAGGGIGLLLILLPLKIEHMVDNLEGDFFGNAQDALQQEINNMVQQYIINQVLPSYLSEACGSTVQAGCEVRTFGKSPVSDLYRTWANDRLEQKLAKGFEENGQGILLKRDRLSQTWTVYGPGLSKHGENIGGDGKGLVKVFDTHSDFKNFVGQWMKDNTEWYQIHKRFQVNLHLVANKYGNNRFCVIACFLTDPFHDKIDKQKLAAKVYLTRNVIVPLNQSVGISLLCLIQIQTCNPTDTQPNSDAVNGADESDYDTDQRNALIQYAQQVLGRELTEDELDKALDAYNGIAKDGFQQYLISKALTPIFGDEAAGYASKLVPIAGWVNFLSQIVGFGDHSSDTLKKMRYVTIGAAAVGTYVMYRSQADEIHTGMDTATEVGSFANSLNPGNQGLSTDPIVGGTAGADQVPLYKTLVGGESAANAAASVATNYICNNGSPLPAGQLICSEEFLGGGSSITNAIHNFLNLPGLNVVTGFANAWNASVGQIWALGDDVTGAAFNAAMGPVNAACDHLPGGGPFAPYCLARNEAEKILPEAIKGIAQWLIPMPFSTNMSGGRTFDMIAAGADVLGNDDAHTMLGGQLLNSVQVGEIRARQQNFAQEEFEKQPLFARMFDTGSQYSLVSKVAMDMPLGGTQAAAQSGLATLLNPLSALSHGFGSIFTGKAHADPEAAPDPFGVPQYGYPDGTIPKDPDAYWNANCSDNAAFAYGKDNSWNEAAAGSNNVDPENGMPMNTTTNACLLIKAAAGASGGLFDTSNLTKEDLGDVTAGDVAAADEGGSVPASDTIDMNNLYQSSVNISCAPNTKDLGIADGYTNGKKVKIRICAISNVPSTASESNNQYGVSGADGKLVVNSRISQVMYDMAAAAIKDGVSMTSDPPDSGFRTMQHQECLYAHTCGSNTAAKPGYSNHQMGLAVDWGQPMIDWLAKGNGAKWGFKALVSGEPWHWSPTGN